MSVSRSGCARGPSHARWLDLALNQIRTTDHARFFGDKRYSEKHRATDHAVTVNRIVGGALRSIGPLFLFSKLHEDANAIGSTRTLWNHSGTPARMIVED